MDERQRKHIELITARELDLATRSISTRANEIYADHGFRKILGSGATIKKVIAACDEIANNLLSDLLAKVGGVSKSPEAMDFIASTLADFFPVLDQHATKAGRMGSRSMANDPPQSILDAIAELLEKSKSDIRTRIEIERFAFETPVELAERQVTLESDYAAPLIPNKGGKPLAEHWDAMWAEIAFQLFSGALQPKRQADITKAMNDWLAEKGFDAGDTAVTKRARALWQRMERG